MDAPGSEDFEAVLGKALREAFRISDDRTDAPRAVPKVAVDDIPTMIGSYAILGVIDRGGMGIVLRAHDRRFERDVAIKLMTTSVARARRELFEKEAKVLARLEHPSIVPIHDLGQLPDGRSYFVMRILHGVPLTTLLRDREAAGGPAARFLRIFLAVCDVIAFAHENAVTHRDLKPSNIMVGPNDEVSVIDWGLAVSPNEGGAPPFAGTPAYMSPEQATGLNSSALPQNDVFALGAILCELLTCSPPYQGEVRDEIILKATRGWTQAAIGRLEAHPNRELAILAMECLAGDPSERPQNGRAVAARVARYLDSLAERAEQFRLQLVRKRARALRRQRNRRIAGALALGVVVVVGAILVFWLRSMRELDRRNAELRKGIATATERVRTSSTQHRLDPQGWNFAVTTAEELYSRSRTLDPDHETTESARKLMLAARQGREQAARDQEINQRLTRACQGLSSTGRRKLALSVLSELGAGLDHPPSYAAQIIREHVLRASVIGLLDEWLMSSRDDTTTDEVTLNWMDQVVDLADGDTTRARIRVAWRERDERQLRLLATDAQTNGFSPVTWRLLVTALNSGGQEGLALDVLRQASFSHPDDWQLHHDLGRRLMELDACAEALTPLSMALALNKTSVDGLIHLAEASRRLGRHHETLRLANAALAIEPDNFWAALNRALSQWELGAKDGAVATLSDLNNDLRTPNEAIALSFLAVQLGRFGTGIKIVTEAIQRDPAAYRAQQQAGGLLMVLGRLEEAEEILRDVVAKHPSYALGLATLGRILALRRSEEAPRYLDLALQHSGLNTSIAVEVGRAYKDLGMYREAVAAFTNAQTAAKSMGRVVPEISSLIDVAKTFEELRNDLPSKAATKGRSDREVLVIALTAAAAENHRLASELNATLADRLRTLPPGFGFSAARSAAALGLSTNPAEAPESPQQRSAWLGRARGWLSDEIEAIAGGGWSRRDFSKSLLLVQALFDPTFDSLRGDAAPDEWGELWQEMKSMLEDMDQ